MYQEILINIESPERRVALIENEKLEEFYVERQDTQRLVGNIYKGVVEAVVPAIKAAFINLGLEKNGFLYTQDLMQPDYEKITENVDKPYSNGDFSEQNRPAQVVNIKDKLKIGQEILVQVVKEPIGSKGPRLTTHISLPGRYIVLMPCNKHIGISRRIQDNRERTRLKELLKELKIGKEMGIVVRTAGSGATKKDFLQDLRYLSGLWRKMKVLSQRKTAPALIHEEYDLVIRIIRDKFTAQTNRLWVDSKDEYKRIMRFLNIFSPKLKNRVYYYVSDIPLFEKKKTEDEIDKIHERKVNLKSGGYITIEPTESLIAIDVNSAKCTGKKDLEETAYAVNLEAAREIARQMRLRDIGGIIVIDFIDMKQARHRKRVYEVLNEMLKRDHAKTDISAVSELGLIEMTRQRARKSFESVMYKSCPYCLGKGLVKSPATVSIMVLRKLKKILQKVKKKTILVYAHPQVVLSLLNDNRSSIYSLEGKFRTKILIRPAADLHMEKFKIEPV